MVLLSNPYLVAVGIPLILIFSGALAKKLVRGSGWLRADFFLGVELSLSAMTAALVYVFDLARLTAAGSAQLPTVSQSIIATASFIALCFFLLLWILSVHQDWEKRVQNQNGQFVWLGIIANFIGAGLLVAFILLVKGL